MVYMCICSTHSTDLRRMRYICNLGIPRMRDIHTGQVGHTCIQHIQCTCMSNLPRTFSVWISQSYLDTPRLSLDVQLANHALWVHPEWDAQTRNAWGPSWTSKDSPSNYGTWKTASSIYVQGWRQRLSTDLLETQTHTHTHTHTTRTHTHTQP